jgi:hypothetical protein
MIFLSTLALILGAMVSLIILKNTREIVNDIMTSTNYVASGSQDPAGKKDKGVHISLTDDPSRESYKDEDFEDY